MSDPIRARLDAMETRGTRSSVQRSYGNALRAVLQLCEQKDDVDEPLWPEVVRDVIAEHLGVTDE